MHTNPHFDFSFPQKTGPLALALDSSLKFKLDWQPLRKVQFLP